MGSSPMRLGLTTDRWSGDPPRVRCLSFAKPKIMRSESEAKGMAKEHADPTFVAFKCRHCGTWHLGHKRNPEGESNGVTGRE